MGTWAPLATISGLNKNRCSFLGRVGGATIASVRYERTNPLYMPLLICKRGINPIKVHALSCFAASLIVWFCWSMAVTETSAIVFCALFGTFGGALFSLPASGVAYLIHPDYAGSLGTWTGIMWGSCSVFALTGPLITGSLVKNFGITSAGHWSGGNLFIAGCFLAAIISMERRAGKVQERHAAQSEEMGVRSNFS